MGVEIKTVKIDAPKDCNLIFGQSHFIKTVEDLYEAIVNTVPQAKFGLAFSESSGPCLVRSAGNDEELKKAASENVLKIACGHCFLIFLRNAYPINVLARIKSVPEFVSLYCATSNPVEVVIAETRQGRGVMGVIDGLKPNGIESEKDVEERKAFLRKIGYKL